MASIGILGYGEIGKAIARFYKKPNIKDLTRDDSLRGVDVLHICIPWSSKFADIVAREIKEAKPLLTIIHSTVAPGTTKHIIQKLPKELHRVVHSPVRGMHPHLEESMKTFVKYIGAEDRKAGEWAKKYFATLGVKTKVFTPAATTELGKLLDTTYYGLVIAWHGEMAKMCDKLGVDFGQAVTDLNKTYNEGYTKLGMPHVVRPVLYPPKQGIGGHCIIPNAKILKDLFQSTALDLVVQYAPKKQKK